MTDRMTKPDRVLYMKVSSRDIIKSRGVGDLLHLSFNGKLEGMWSPVSPAGTELVSDKDVKYGEPTTPRISGSPTLEQCFRAIYPNIDFYFKDKKYPHLDIYVYRPDFKGHERVVLPETLTKNKWVWDAHITKEHWILDKVRMVLSSRYRFYNTEDGSKGLVTRPYNDAREPLSSYVGPTQVKYEEIESITTLESDSIILNW